MTINQISFGLSRSTGGKNSSPDVNNMNGHLTMTVLYNVIPSLHSHEELLPSTSDKIFYFQEWSYSQRSVSQWLNVMSFDINTLKFLSVY